MACWRASVSSSGGYHLDTRIRLDQAVRYALDIRC